MPTPQRTFRFSLQAVAASSRAEWVELARKVEGLGFSLLVTPDHIGPSFAPMAPLVTAAEATTTLRVGTLVLNNDLRHPVLVAREVATIDLLTEGRFELGIGAGHAFTEYERCGLDFDPGSMRIGRLSESVQLIRRLLDGESVDFAGDHYHLAGESCFPHPAQAHVPIIVGGGGKRVLAVASRFADTIGLSGLGRTQPDGQHHEPAGFPPAAVDEQVAWIEEHTTDRDVAPERQVLVQQVILTDSPYDVADELGRGLLRGLKPSDILETPYMLIGSTKAMIEKLHDVRARWGISHFTFRVADLDAAAPIVEALAGQ